MSRVRLRLTLGYVICKHYNGDVLRVSVKSIKRKITRNLLTSYGIRRKTEISEHDWLMACQHALDLRRKPNTFCTIRETTGHPTYMIVNKLFGIG